MITFLSYVECCQGLNQLESALSITIDEENGDEVAHQIATLANLQGFSARLMASCEYLHWTDKKSIEYRCMYTLAERLNNCMGKGIMAYQSVLGKLREEKKASVFGG